MSPRLSELPLPPLGHTGWPWTAETPPALYEGKDVWSRITIVTPSFNQALYLEETIRSVLLQGYPNLQYIVIDGGSTDGSQTIIEKYARWLDYWVSEPDGGQSHAINKGLSRATGEWFNWINSDDYLLPGALAALATRTDTPIVVGLTRNLRDGQLAETYGSRLIEDFPAGLFSLAVNQPGSLLRLPPVPERMVCESLHYVMDFELWLRLLLQHGRAGITTIPQEVAVYRYHATSKTCSKVDAFALEEFAVLHDLCVSLAPDHILPGLAEVRALCAASRVDFVPPLPIGRQPAVIRAFLRRLLVTDSLLFRALRRHFGDTPATCAHYIRALDQLRPALMAIHPGDYRQQEGRAVVHALEEFGRLASLSLVWRALRNAPSLTTCRALLHLWLFPKRAYA